MEKFIGKQYKLTKSENFEEFMKGVGAGLMVRKMVCLLTPTMELKKEGDVYTLYNYSTFKNMVTSFKLGEEFDDIKPDGTKLRATYTVEGNKLITIERSSTGIDTHIIREFTDKEVHCTMTVKDVVCTRVFTLIE